MPPRTASAISTAHGPRERALGFSETRNLPPTFLPRLNLEERYLSHAASDSPQIDGGKPRDGRYRKPASEQHKTGALDVWAFGANARDSARPSAKPMRRRVLPGARYKAAGSALSPARFTSSEDQDRSEDVRDVP